MKAASTLLVAAALVGACASAGASGLAGLAVSYTVTSTDPSQTNPWMQPAVFYSGSTWSDAPAGFDNTAQGYFSPNLLVAPGSDPNGWGVVAGDGSSTIVAVAVNTPGQVFTTLGQTSGFYTLTPDSQVTLNVFAVAGQFGGTQGGGSAGMCFADTQCANWGSASGLQSNLESFTFTNNTGDYVPVDFNAYVFAYASGVPEPTTPALMLAALGLAAFVARRRPKR